MRNAFCSLVVVAAANALSINRRAFAVGVAGVPAAASAAGPDGSAVSTALNMFSASDPTKSPFQGYYKDPEHLEGYRIIKASVDSGELTVTGRDAPDGDEFVLRGTITSQFSAIIDFSPKGGPKNLNARFQLVSGRPIVSFPDGNGWARISDKPAIPAPVDLKREQPMQADKRSGLAKLRGALDTDQLQKDSQAAGFSFPKLPFS